MAQVVITEDASTITFTFTQTYRQIIQGSYTFPKTTMLIAVTDEFSLLTPLLISIYHSDIIFTTTLQDGDDYVPTSAVKVGIILNEMINT